MELKHKQPCNECPWRKKSLAGWLGGHSAEYYADAVQKNEIPPCHNVDFGPDDDRSAFCVGALAVGSNQCILPRNTDGAQAAQKKITKKDACFGSVYAFYEHHTKEKYINPLMRMLGVSA